MTAEPLLEARGLSVSFRLRDREIRVVEGVDLTLARGEVLGLIGESGSGKTVSSLALLRLLPEHAVIAAERLRFEGQEIQSLSRHDFDQLRGRRMAMIFQDPVGSFNPVKSIGWHFREATHRARRDETGADTSAWRDEAIRLLKQVGIPHAETVLRAYPHQLSGGMLQRALIALVLQLRPALIVADEPTTNLDNIVERQIIDLFRTLRQETQASFLFITHDMSVAEQLCDRVAVMYAGQIVEVGTAEEIFAQPRHPYAQGLLRTSTELERRVARLKEIPGELPNWKTMPAGCRFEPRCELARAGCSAPQPLRPLDGEGAVRCLLYREETQA